MIRLALVAVLALPGCAMTPTQKKVTATVAVMVVVGVVASKHSADRAQLPAPPDCAHQPQVCK